MRKIVFDIETLNTFSDVGSNDPAALDLSLVGIWDSETGSYKSFVESELPSLWPMLETCDILIGFNSDHFDIPLLDKYYPGDLQKIKSVDLLKEIRAVAGRRMKLDQLAEGTLGIKKSGSGMDAIIWWRQGEIEKIRKYCLDDVRITKDLYEYAVKNGKLAFKEGPHIHEVKLDTSAWESLPTPTAMNFTLPF